MAMIHFDIYDTFPHMQTQDVGQTIGYCEAVLL